MSQTVDEDFVWLENSILWRMLRGACGKVSTVAAVDSSGEEDSNTESTKIAL